MGTLVPFSIRRRAVSLPGGAFVLALAFIGALIAAPGEANAQARIRDQTGGSYAVSVMSWRDIPFRTVVRQQYDYSCGSAALATLLRYHYGVEVGEGEIFRSMYEVGDQARIREVGFSMLDMKRYLESRGFQADGLRLTLDRIDQIGAPMIALITHENYRHFVVIKGLSDGRVLVGDPTFGIQTYTREEFLAVWNGIVLAVRGTPEGIDGGVFNLASDWRPWSSAPYGAARDLVSPSDLLREMPGIYQITDTALQQ